MSEIDKIKILIASGSRHCIPPLKHSPGVARIIEALALALSKEGYDVKVISQYHPLLEKKDHNQKIFLHPKISWPTKVNIQFLRKLPYRWLKKIYGFTQVDRIAYYKGLVKLAKKEKPDLVISFMHIELFKMLHKALPQSQHIYFFRSTNLKQRIGFANMDYLVKHSAGFLANTQSPIKELKAFKTFNFPTKTIYNAILHKKRSEAELLKVRNQLRAHFNIHQEAQVIGFAGRFSKEKSLLELFKAVATLNKNGGDYHLLIAGDISNEKTPNRDYYNALKSFEAENLTHKIHWLGWVTHKDLWKFYSSIDYGVVLSKYSEGNSMFLLESLYYGIPVIATEIGGNAEVIRNNYNGYLIDVADIENELVKVFKNNFRNYKDLSLNAKKHINENHTKGIMIQQFFDFIKKFDH